MAAPEIVTARTRLTQLGGGDAEALFAYRSDPDVGRYQSWVPGSLDDVRRFIAGLESVAYDTPGTWCQLGIRLRDGGRLIGDLGVHVLAADPRQVEIGVTVSPARQRRGFALEAVTGVLDHLFGALGKHRVTASVDPRNGASMALFRRVGMREEAHLRESLWFKGEWADDVVFAVLTGEWEARQR